MEVTITEGPACGVDSLETSIDRPVDRRYNGIMDTLEKLRKNGISLSYSEISDICSRYSIVELGVFGSSLRDDFGDASDIDFLVTFKSDAKISLFDIMDLEEELKKKFNREIDVVEKEALRNPYRRRNILETSEIVYAAS